MNHPERLYLPVSGVQIAKDKADGECVEYIRVPKGVPFFVLRADTDNHFDALCLAGQLTEKPSLERDEILDAALEFSQYRDSVRFNEGKR